VISADHVQKARVPEFVGEEESHDLHIIEISIYIVSLEKIFFVRWWAYLVEKSKEILELPMCISRYNYWGLHLDYYWFFF